MAKILGHDIVNAEEFGQFLDGEYKVFKQAVENTSQANAQMLLYVAATTDAHKKDIKRLKIAFIVTAIILVMGVFAIMH